MLLVIDIGNTNIKFGLFEGEELKYSWRVAVKVTRTSDEFGMIMGDLFGLSGVQFSDITGIIMSSVSPEINYTIEHACTYYMGIKPMVVGPGIKTGINIKYTNTFELGADRIVNSVGAYTLYGAPLIVVDFGTATTFNFISRNGEFLGGCIAPGIKSATESLFENTSRLSRVELVKPSCIIAKNTDANIQAGTVFGFTGLVDYIVGKMKEESGEPDARVIATGGLSNFVLDEKPGLIDIQDRSLTLKGLKIIYDMNKK